MKLHNIVSARFKDPEPAGGYTPESFVVAVMKDGSEITRRYGDDIDGGGMLDYRADGGGVDAYVAPPLTESDYTAAIKQRLRDVAIGRGYDDEITLMTYAMSNETSWRAEAEAFAQWRDSVWASVFAIYADVQSGARQQPTVEELINEIPQISWPT